ncbi:MFS transporter [Agrobacterium larrymoorei]|uniref:MFS transporter n=1 Tax=Agrobacterium larrymoorei TaxID=160699 RepID=A0A4D7DM28_9HYPH|nr:MFS transporter [Agrobacterium larrymoorei]QCI96754.1 MFS transporter [Agrobacterium larrymoorei]QYA07819.1 MFS transporter [Agrobacterium larrymoorei]
MTGSATQTTTSTRMPYMTRTRLGVSLLFLMNGFMMGSWAPMIPEFAKRLSLSESALGLVILVFGLGSLACMPIAGSQIARFGSRTVTLTVAFIFVPTLLLITLSNTIWAGVITVFLFGGLTGAMDVGMNANAVAVERSMRRAIMSSCHAFWSLGGLLGAGLGGLLITKAGIYGHAIALTIIAAILLAVAWPRVMVDRPHPEEERPKGGLPMTPLPWIIGIIALFSMIPEGAILDWGALYLRNELGASVAFSGFGFAAFSMTMAIMRFAGDLVRDRFGAVRTLQFCSAMSILGLLIAGLAGNAFIAIAGFAIAGIGISNMVPIAFSAAGNMPGLAPGIGLSVVTTMGYSGILVAPSAIGFIAEHTGLASVFIGLPLLHIVVFSLAKLARHADGASGH